MPKESLKRIASSWETSRVNVWLGFTLLAASAPSLCSQTTLLVSTRRAGEVVAQAVNLRVTFNGYVDPSSLPARVWFEWGPGDRCDQCTPAIDLSAAAIGDFSTDLTGLTAGMIYHYRAVASNALGVRRGRTTPFAAPMLSLKGPNPMILAQGEAYVDPGFYVSALPLTMDAGRFNNILLTADGTPLVWGDSSEGLTNLPTLARSVVALEAGFYHALARLADNSLYGWGLDNYSQANVPPTVDNVRAFAAGGYHSLALTADGSIHGWGRGDYGQTTAPIDAYDLVALAAGLYHSSALRGDGRVLVWGSNTYGQTNVPPEASNVVAIASGTFHSLALREDGRVVAWGRNDFGQTDVPVGLANVVAVAGGSRHSVALRADGSVVAWGRNDFGQTNVPATATSVVALASGGDHNLVVKENGELIAWGANDFGEAQAAIYTGELDGVPEIGGSLDVNLPGIYDLTYRATNILGGVNTVTRKVIVSSLVQGAEAWVRRYSYPVDVRDVALKVLTDSVGNVIVAGTTQTRVTDADWLILKYNSAGAALWTNFYNGPGNLQDTVRDVAVDESGNVYVTGFSTGLNDLYGVSRDYVTVAYDSQGRGMWTNRYDGLGNASDQAEGVAVAEDGNVFVTGRSTGADGSLDYATVAYSRTGLALWTNFYNGPDNLGDQATAVEVDRNGNVFVTGFSGTTAGPGGAASDFATVAYSRTGVALWTNRYDGPASGDDDAIALAVDGNGTVVVTGLSEGSNRWFDYATVAYSSAGVAVWTNRFSGADHLINYPSAVTVDGSGNVVVTGSSWSGTSESDYATVAYSFDGLALWTNYYNGPDNDNDIATALEVSHNGNVYVTGRSFDASGAFDFVTVAYSSAGMGLWTNRYDGPSGRDDYAVAVAVDGSGNAYVTGFSIAEGDTTDSDCVTVAYNSAGTQLWLRHYAGAGNDYDRPTAVVVDRLGNIYVTGYSGTSTLNGGDEDYVTVAYDRDGGALWTNRYDGPASSEDQTSGAATDANGNVYVTGSSTGNGTFYDYATVAYDSAGEALWTNRYNGPLNSNDISRAVVADASGNVYVTGTTSGLGTSSDYATIAYSNTGVGLWTNRFNGPGNDEDQASAMALDPNGNVVVTGISYQENRSSDFATLAYSSSGVALWTNYYHGTPRLYGLNSATAVAVSPRGNVYVTGVSEGTNGFTDYATVAYAGDGFPLWTNRYNGPWDSHDYATAIAAGRAGNVYVTGTSLGTQGHADYATVAYNRFGIPLWTNRYNGPANSGDSACAVVVETNGNVVVTGSSQGIGTKTDFATVAYTSDGVGLWTNRYNGPANSTDAPRTQQSLAVTPDGVVVVGSSDGDYTVGSSYGPLFDYAVVKYVSALTPVIITHPMSQTIPAGTSATFSVSAAGTPPLNYQWTFKGAPIPGANADSFVLTNAQPSDAGDYAVIVSNLAGASTSSPAALLVNLSGELHITALERMGDGLQLTFESRLDNNYVIQSRTNLDAGAWQTLPGTYTGTGDILSITVFPNPMAQQQFYRIKQSPSD